MVLRLVTVAVAIIIGAVAMVLFVGNANEAADRIRGRADANESMADSAPQQQVVASWAIQDATEEQVRLAGLRNGLLGVAAALLGALVVWQALRPSIRTGDEGSVRSPGFY